MLINISKTNFSKSFNKETLKKITNTMNDNKTRSLSPIRNRNQDNFNKLSIKIDDDDIIQNNTSILFKKPIYINQDSNRKLTSSYSSSSIKSMDSTISSYDLSPTASSIFLPSLTNQKLEIIYSPDNKKNSKIELIIDYYKECLSCSKKFLPKKEKHKYCSYRCYKLTHKDINGNFNIKCMGCTKKFKTKNIFTDYCCDACYQKAIDMRNNKFLQ